MFLFWLVLSGEWARLKGEAGDLRRMEKLTDTEYILFLCSFVSTSTDSEILEQFICILREFAGKLLLEN